MKNTLANSAQLMLKGIFLFAHIKSYKTAVSGCAPSRHLKLNDVKAFFEDIFGFIVMCLCVCVNNNALIMKSEYNTQTKTFLRKCAPHKDTHECE